MADFRDIQQSEHEDEIGSKITVKKALKVRVAYSGSNVQYVGFALTGSATSAAVWRIMKLTYSGSDVTQIDWASSSTAFSFIWDSRTGYTYG